jgi:hypothetical protein
MTRTGKGRSTYFDHKRQLSTALRPAMRRCWAAGRWSRTAAAIKPDFRTWRFSALSATLQPGGEQPPGFFHFLVYGSAF